MDFIDGVPIPFSHDFDPEDETQTRKLYKQLCQISYQLSNLQFNKIVSLATGTSPSQIVLGPRTAHNMALSTTQSNTTNPSQHGTGTTSHPLFPAHPSPPGPGKLLPAQKKISSQHTYISNLSSSSSQTS